MDIHKAYIEHQNGKLTDKELIELQIPGYSVNGWCDAVDDHVPVVLDNPFWPHFWISSAGGRKDVESDDEDDTRPELNKIPDGKFKEMLSNISIAGHCGQDMPNLTKKLYAALRTLKQYQISSILEAYEDDMEEFTERCLER